MFPSEVWYNRDLFDEAGLAYPPHTYGDQYEGADWDFDAVANLAMQLTVDGNGVNAASADFDAENIVQWGWITQWTDSRGEATLFGAASPYDEATGKAVIPDAWREAWHWYYDGIWEQHFIPNDTHVSSDLLGGNPFASGNLAMAHVHTWYACCVAGAGAVDNWDWAVVPSYKGVTTAKLHADTFRIMNTSQHPEEAFEVLTFLLGEASPELLLTYGGMPARQSQQDAFFAALDEKFPQGVDWNVGVQGLSYPDNPNHEGWMPNVLLANDKFGAFQQKYRSTPDLDLDAEIDTLQADLQRIFDSAYSAG